jgi:ABC-type bacteriocin/lantibiotic exporter with double-glycine peptidase domain
MSKLLKIFFSLLNYNQKRYLIFIIILSFIAALLEMISLGLLVPLISFLNGENLINNFAFKNISSTINLFFNNFNNNIVLVLIFFFAIFVFKTIFFTVLNKLILKFSNNLNFIFSSKIFENYLYQNYCFYLARGSSKLIQNITNETSNLINVYLASILSLFNEILLLISISAILIILSPISFFTIIFIFFLFFFIFIFVIKKKLKNWGYQRQYHQENSIRCLQEGMKGIKELRIYNLENNFLEYFKFHINKYLKVEENINFFSTIPKYYIELLGVISFVIIFKILLINNQPNSEIIIILGVFAASALKILPSLNRIINSIVRIKYSYSAVNLIYNEVNLKKFFYQNAKNKKINFSNNLTLNKVYFKYYNQKNFLFENINLKIPFNKIIGIFGESGSGKTTFVDLIIGFLNPTKGTINVDDINISKNIRSWQDNVAYVQQFSFFSEDTIKNNIAFGSKDNLIDTNNIYYFLSIVGLKEFVDKLPKKIETKISELGNNFSGGQRQRLNLARALYLKKKILILDEATNSLDDKSEKEVIKKILSLSLKTSVFVITHKKSFAKYCDLIINIDKKIIKIQKNKLKKLN